MAKAMVSTSIGAEGLPVKNGEHLLMADDPASFTESTLRLLPSDLKKNMEAIAAREGRGMGQVCEAFLRAGSEGYKKEGPKFLRRFFGRQKLTP